LTETEIPESGLVDLFLQYLLLKRRNPLQSARETIRRSWMTHLDEAAHKASILSHMQLPPLGYYRILQEETYKIFDRVESRLSADILRVLLKSDNPDSLNELYWLEEEQAPNRSDQAQQTRLPNVARTAEPDRATIQFDPAGVEQLVRAFLDMSGQRFCQNERDRRAAEQMLHDFLHEFPLASARP
jgi:plasmid stabilization system protein ParE